MPLRATAALPAAVRRFASACRSLVIAPRPRICDRCARGTLAFHYPAPATPLPGATTPSVSHLFLMSISSPPAPISVRVDGSYFCARLPLPLASARAKSTAWNARGFHLSSYIANTTFMTRPNSTSTNSGNTSSRIAEDSEEAKARVSQMWSVLLFLVFFFSFLIWGFFFISPTGLPVPR